MRTTRAFRRRRKLRRLLWRGAKVALHRPPPLWRYRYFHFNVGPFVSGAHLERFEQQVLLALEQVFHATEDPFMRP